LEFKIDNKGKSFEDLEISGLGWISITNNKPKEGVVRLVVYLPEHVHFEKRENILR
jgi:hypothetical protein